VKITNSCLSDLTWEIMEKTMLRWRRRAIIAELRADLLEKTLQTNQIPIDEKDRLIR